MVSAKVTGLRLRFQAIGFWGRIPACPVPLVGTRLRTGFRIVEYTRVFVSRKGIVNLILIMGPTHGATGPGSLPTPPREKEHKPKVDPDFAHQVDEAACKVFFPLGGIQNPIGFGPIQSVRKFPKPFSRGQ